MTAPYAAERRLAEKLARQAGEVLLAHRAAGFQVNYKTSQDDPVTVADTEASALIVAGLRAAFPDDGILSEELTDTAERLGKRRVWIIDPIDGTKEYVEGSTDFAVSIGLAVDGEAVMGVVYAPAQQALYSGEVGVGVFRNGEPAGFSARPPQQAVIWVSDTEYKRELHQYPLANMRPSGSIALKLALIAAGETDATFTMSPRASWDLAAGMALVRAAGGTVTRRGGGRIELNAPQTSIRQGLIGGRSDVVAWLEQELARLAVPEQQLNLVESDAAWALLPPPEQERLRGEAHLHLRHAAGQMVALLLLRPAGPALEVVRAEGDAAHLKVLVRDVTRAYGPLQGSPTFS
ncbi:3'(2'),5'-bisphosphate nucleotidase CysQ [Deinococcus irradiatisoli]|uniref:3'(2'),5'-bisphosphate nucleotidase CysQ n=1 Tax=Deinococcus irradiatisoli TaxID=2202254 RepID=A0A2Z3JH57_9DEIO|nr:3'(2'),5'-bisphosphate nucleotidase CysQ [Deinococcus irradiatisoli]AWN24517.1 3'(2'),5'-bisphosphate nucleotidase CysQ [Deinococcus irradiatisoli]